MVKLIFFGQLAEITGKHTMELEDVIDTNDLQQKLLTCFPDLAGSTYRIAVDKKLVTQNVALQNNVTIALLPPFSGG